MGKITIERELELIDGMIDVQLHHAAQCDGIANRTMADKQKGWDMERVALLRKMRAALAAQPVAWRKTERMYHEYEGSAKDDNVGYLVTRYSDTPNPGWEPLYAAQPAPAALEGTK